MKDVRGKILDRLGYQDKRVLHIYRLETGLFRLEEACDQYFYEDLTPEELAQLGHELIAAANQS